MHLNGLLAVLLVAVVAEKAVVADTMTTTEASEKEDVADDAAAAVDDEVSPLLSDILKPTALEGITIPDNALTIGFQSVGVFLLLAGVVAYIAYLVLGDVDKYVAATGTGVYPYSASTGYASGQSATYAVPGTDYAAPANYAPQEAYSVHRSIDKAAEKYQ